MLERAPNTTTSRVTTRLDGLDLARCLAFFGMVIVNFAVVMGAEGTGQSSFAATLIQALQGRAAATFVVLAGLGLGLAAQHSTSAFTLSITLRRAAFLLALGLLNMLVFDADILHYYAFYFLFGALLLPLSTRALSAIIAALCLLFTVLILTLNYDAGWNWQTYTYSGFWTPTGFVRNLFFNGWHPVIPWLGFFVFGLILARLPLSRAGTQRKLLLGGVLGLAAAHGLSAAALALAGQQAELQALLTTQPVPPMPLYMLAGLSAASILIALCLLAAQAARSSGVLAILAPAGRQTLTLYIAHILLGMGLLEELGLLGEQTPQTALASAALFCAAALLYAWLWARVFKRGPIEALMRKLAG